MIQGTLRCSTKISLFFPSVDVHISLQQPSSQVRGRGGLWAGCEPGILCCHGECPKNGRKGNYVGKNVVLILRLSYNVVSSDVDFDVSTVNRMKLADLQDAIFAKTCSMILKSFFFLLAKCTFVRTHWFRVFAVLVAVVKSKVAIVKLRYRLH